MPISARHRTETSAHAAALREAGLLLGDAGVALRTAGNRIRTAHTPQRVLVALGAVSLALSLVGIHDVPAATAAPVDTEPAVAVVHTPPPPPAVIYTSVAAVGPVSAPRDDYGVTILPPPETPDDVSWPVPATTPISSPFGPREAPCPTCSTWHRGIDLIPGEGSPVAAIADGTVVEAAGVSDGELGVHVVIRHSIHGEVVDSVYGHLLDGTMPLHVGDRVRRGQLLGLVGSTGESTGPHLHFGILHGSEPVDPVTWMAAHVNR